MWRYWYLELSKLRVWKRPIQIGVLPYLSVLQMHGAFLSVFNTKALLVFRLAIARAIRLWPTALLLALVFHSLRWRPDICTTAELIKKHHEATTLNVTHRYCSPLWLCVFPGPLNVHEKCVFLIYSLRTQKPIISYIIEQKLLCAHSQYFSQIMFRWRLFNRGNPLCESNYSRPPSRQKRSCEPWCQTLLNTGVGL